MDDTETSGGLDSLVEQRNQVLWEARSGLDKRHQEKVAVKEKANAKISIPSAGLTVKPRDLARRRG